jgi:ATP-binding cassette subfamily C protein
MNAIADSELIQVERAKPFNISEPVYLRSGYTTLFLAEDIPGVGVGRRVPVATVHAPAIVNPGAAPSGRVWVLAHHASAIEVALTQATEEELAVAMAATAETLNSVIRPSVPPPGDRINRLGTRPVFVSAGRTALVDRLSWVRAVEGEPRLANVLLPESGGPVGERMSIVGEGFSALTALPLDSIAIEERVASLRWLFEVAGKCVLEAFDEREALEHDMAMADPMVSAEVEAAGVRMLAREITSKGKNVVVAPSGEPLVLVSSIVAQLNGYDIEVPRGGLRGREGTSAVRAIATTSGLYVRTVTLPKEWWVDTVEPMVGFSVDGQPLALVIRGNEGVIITADGAEIDPTSPESPALIENAFVFSKPPVGEDLDSTTLLKLAFKGERRQIIRVFLWALVIAGVSLTVPLASGVVFGEIIPEGDRTRLAWLLVALVTAAIAVLPVQIAQTAASTRLEASVSLNLQRGIWGRVLRSPVTLVKRLGPGDLVMRLSALEMARDAMEQSVIGALPVVIGALVSVVILFIYIPILALIAVVWGLLVLGTSLIFASRVAKAQRTVDEATGNVNGFLYQVLGAIPKLHVAGAEPRAFAAWAQRFRGAVGQELTIRTSHQVLFGGIVGTLSTAVLFAGVAITDSGKNVGAFIAFQTTYGLFMAGIMAFVTGIGTTMQMRPAMQRAAELVADAPESGEGRSDPGPLRGDVALRGVTFRYQPDMPAVLDELDLRINAGEMVAVVGHSGCGKSTLLRVLLGFETPEQGSVLFDDQDLSSLDVESVRRQLGVVLQDGQLMPGTIHQNLAGATTLSPDEAWELAEIVALADDIRAMPMKLETMITLNGGAFSGGQRQRLLIARALAARPRILLLDEATSALDNVTQRVVTQNLAELGMTRIVVAHRLSTIIDADRIVVFEAGRVVEDGSYEELMEQRGAFHALATRQVL